MQETMRGNAQTDALTASTVATIERFNDAFNRHDVDAVMAAMTDDCVFESTAPAPDGARYEGQAAVRGFWEELFRSSPRAHFAVEDLFAAGDRCTVRWLYRWVDRDGKAGHVRGVDVFRVRDGKVAEKLSYVKG
jgi:ketosteroid isomerase-like protein